MKQAALSHFLQEVDAAAPWFAVSGNLTMARWKKLGKDLEDAEGNGTLHDKKGKASVLAMWKIVKTCLESVECSEAVEKVVEVVEQVKEALSETKSERSVKGQQELRAGPKTGSSLYPDLRKEFESDQKRMI